MAAPAPSAAQKLVQLENARSLALSDPQVYTQFIPGVLPIISPPAPLEIRRWGADFIAEGFATPSLSMRSKEDLVTAVVPVLKRMLDDVNQDAMVVRSAIQTAASIYGLVFRRIISQPDQASLWDDMTNIKLNILRRMDNPPMAVRICCIKFVQKVVQVQTPGLIADPRRPDHNETSIALVPRNHPLLPVQNIEAETSGLLDRLLSVLQEQSGDPVLVDATLNCLAVLIRTRPAVSNKILSTILNYNPLKHATTPMTPRQMVIIKSLERTTRALLKNVMKNHPNHPMGAKIAMYQERLQQSKTALLADTQATKRPAEAMDGPDAIKRQRLTQEPRSYPPMPPPPNTVAQLFTLTTDTVLQQFDVKYLEPDMVATIVGLLLEHIDSLTLDEAIEAVRQRYAQLQKAAQLSEARGVPLAGPTGIDDEDDYDPEFVGGSDTAIAPSTEKALEELAQPMLELGPYELPKPPPLSATEVAILSDQTVSRVFDIAASFERNPATARQKSGLNRLAASTNDREAWLTLLTRLATRTPASVDGFTASLDSSSSSDSTPKPETLSMADSTESEKPTMANRIRQTLFHYILDDWRARINVAISWLAEEWYSDRLASTHGHDVSGSDADRLPNYTRTLNRLLAQLLPRFDASDSKLLIRFLSELPHLNADILEQVRQLARDPGTVKICTLSLQYLIMFRPPVRNMVLDALEDIWLEGDAGVKESVRKVLLKWRPGFEGEAAAAAQKGSGVSEEIKVEDGMISVSDATGGVNGGGGSTTNPGQNVAGSMADNTASISSTTTSVVTSGIQGQGQGQGQGQSMGTMITGSDMPVTPLIPNQGIDVTVGHHDSRGRSD